MNIKELKRHAIELSDSEDPVQVQDCKEVIAYCEQVEDRLILEQKAITDFFARRITKLLWPEK